MAGSKPRKQRRQRVRERSAGTDAGRRPRSIMQIGIYLVGAIIAFAAVGGVLALVVNSNEEQLPEIPLGDADTIDVPIGTGVGNKIPDVSFRLNDGTTVSTDRLSSNGKPAFLFFFATW